MASRSSTVIISVLSYRLQEQSLALTIAEKHTGGSHLRYQNYITWVPGECQKWGKWYPRSVSKTPDDRSGAASASAGGAFGLAGATTGTADAGVSQTVCSPSRHRGDALARRARHGVTSGQL